MHRIYVSFTCSLLFYVLMFLPTAFANTPEIAEKVAIYNWGSAQFEIHCPGGQAIFVDVVDPEVLTRQAEDTDILLISHGHPDHYNRAYAEAFPGKKIIMESGSLKSGDILVTAIASSHSEDANDELKPQGGSNYIFLIEIDTLRIAHFGDIGQLRFTPEQLGVLGDIDIAMSQFINPLSQMDLQNLKGFKLMQQLSPRVIIPTAHGRFNENMIAHAASFWQVAASEEEGLMFTKASLPVLTTMLIWGDGASFLMEDLKLREW